MASEYRLSSSSVTGRGPTMLMSPFITLKSCGSSSRLDFRKTLPIAVTRGSLRNFQFADHSAAAAGSVARCRRKRSDASIGMVRNFKQSKRFPLNPTRLWRNSTGPGEEQAVSTKQMTKKGASNTIAERAKMISMTRLEDSPIGRRGVAEINRRLLDLLCLRWPNHPCQEPKDPCCGCE